MSARLSMILMVFKELISRGAVRAAAVLAAPNADSPRGCTKVQVLALEFLAVLIGSLTHRAPPDWVYKVKRQLFEAPILRACVTGLQGCEGSRSRRVSHEWVYAFALVAQSIERVRCPPFQVYPDAGMANELLGALSVRGKEKDRLKAEFTLSEYAPHTLLGTGLEVWFCYNSASYVLPGAASLHMDMCCTCLHAFFLAGFSRALQKICPCVVDTVGVRAPKHMSLADSI